ncbi:MAG TPA: pentapeptide repeat-containing protein, partial [Candidatus Obscuribacterales bacterium]
KNADERVFEFFNQKADDFKSNQEGIIALVGLVILSIILAATLVLITRSISQSILDQDGKNTLLQQFAINLASWGGTRFVKANLTDTNFNQALLKSTDFSNADTHHTRWHQAQKLEWAKVAGTILTAPKVQQLLVSLNGYEQSYIGANLQGANLMNANLEYSNLREANLSEATLENANLEWANLSQTQAIGTNFKESRFTGTYGLSTWNIDSTTNLLWVNCKFIYLLEEAKPGTDDRERRPSSGEFKADEFSKLFQEVLNTIDLIFREGIDWRAFIYSFKKVQVQNQETELKIQKIEDKEDGVFIVRVQVPPEADKAKIHQDFTQNYDEAIKTLESQYQEQLKIQESELLNYRQLNSNMMEVVRFLASREIVQEPRFLKKNQSRSGKLVILKIIQGDFKTGFLTTIQIGQDGMLPSTEISASLPAFPELEAVYHQWKSLYEKFHPSEKSRIKAKKINILSDLDSCRQFATVLEIKLKTWLNSESFSSVKERFQQKISPQDETRFMIQTENYILLRLPWHVWNLFDHYPKAEVGLSLPQYDQAEPITSTFPKKRVRILAILGNSDNGINVQKDRAILQQIVGADVTVLEEPKRIDVDVHLRDEMGWDILFFAGHSITQEESGVIYINPNECLTVPDLKYALRFAVQRGLKLAIFNSCDGLGLARDLADLQIAQIIVMREPVPDLIATEFLKSFLSAFSRGKTLYTAVREAREKLHAQEDKYPCASWLPVIFQHPSEVPLMWDDLRGLSTPETELKPFLEILAKLRELFEQNTDLSPLDQANVLEQIQSLVQIAQMPQSEVKQRLGSKALMVIKGTISDLPVTSVLKQQCQLLLTEISQEILG